MCSNNPTFAQRATKHVQQRKSSAVNKVMLTHHHHHHLQVELSNSGLLFMPFFLLWALLPPPLLWKQFRSRRASETIFHLQDSYPCPPGTPPRQLFIHVWLTPWLKLLCTEARRGLFPPLLPISSHKSRNMVSAKLHHNKFKKFGYSILRHFTEKCALEQAYHKKFKWKKVRN